MPGNKSPTAPSLWMQSARISGQQPTSAKIAMVTHHLHPPRTVQTGHDSTQWAEQTALHMIPIVPNATRQDTGDQNAMVASHSNQGMHPHLGHSRGSPDAHLGTTTTTVGRGNKTDTIDGGKDHSPQDEIALHYIQPNMTVRNTHPKEIMVRDVCAPCCNEAYTTISCLQVPAKKGQPHSMLRLKPELEAMCYPSMCFNTFIQIRSAQLTFPLAWITSVPDSLPTTDPIYPYMVHSVGPSLGSQTALALDPTG